MIGIRGTREGGRKIYRYGEGTGRARGRGGEDERKCQYLEKH